jgi:hypothetical protein
MLVAEYTEYGIPLPANRDGRNLLDCLVINQLVEYSEHESQAFQTVRCPYLEGSPIYPGSAILTHSHVQLVVRDRRNILGLFRPSSLDPLEE